ncbi:MAG: zinc-dependent metalloprotease [Parvularculaceae bacterium]|nr:zinc-dependent metalloprotease [Parvularculaceae bacterium]
MRRIAMALAAATLGGCTVENAPGGTADGEPKVLTDHPRRGAALFRAEAGADGRVLITLPKAEGDGVSLRVIHSAGLTAGLGSNPVGLDRGYADSGRVIAFRRVGAKVIIEQENWNYRASADNALEKAAVRQSFANSFLWAGEVAEERPSGAYTVDIASFLTSDVLDLRGALTRGGQGAYSFDKDRSFVEASSLLVFPDNVEIDAHVTLEADKAGGEVAATAADGRDFTLTQHHSFVRLPDDGYKPRIFDPRAGGIDSPFYDFSVKLDEPVIRKYAQRFRLERKDPNAKSGPVKKPIVFYIDPGAPEPVRQALIDGAKWWADAFKAAGFENAYQVELLPEDAHPMDARYNVVQWVHRQTRGWSYGGGVVDPRTGEMIKAHVVLGSQRVRQDRMIFEGLAGASKTGSGAADDPVELSLARIRQLSAHEIGHTLGFAHNFAASTNDRASVMDYPAPYVRPTGNGSLDFSKAYGVGVGDWDKAAATWLYAEFKPGTDEARELDKIIRDAYARGLRFVDDAQARGVESGHPYGAVWDNGGDAVAALGETMRVREIALSNFGLDAIKDGRARSDLNAVLVPIYIFHRYQIDAAAKLVGGYEFQYSLKGDDAPPAKPVSVERQRAALGALVATLDPGALDLPDETLDLLTPDLQLFGGAVAGAELFSSDTGPMFDLLAAADAAASETLTAVLHPVRLARLVEMERRGGDVLTFDETLDAIERQVFWTPATGRQAEIARREQARYVSILIEIASGGALAGESQAPTLGLSFGPGAVATPEVRLRTNVALRRLAERLKASPLDGFGADRTHREALAALIASHLSRPAPALAPSAKASPAPPGSPIGARSGFAEECWFCDL